jgi:hypothetical protein
LPRDPAEPEETAAWAGWAARAASPEFMALGNHLLGCSISTEPATVVRAAEAEMEALEVVAAVAAVGRRSEL